MTNLILNIYQYYQDVNFDYNAGQLVTIRLTPDRGFNTIFINWITIRTAYLLRISKRSNTDRKLTHPDFP